MTKTPSPSDLRAEVAELLVANGYALMPDRIRIGDVELDIPMLWQGPSETLDLTIVTDRPSSREEESRLYWLLQRLTRALDAIESRRTVTLVLMGRPVPSRIESGLLELARVLVVDGSLTTDRMIGPLLRLQLPPSSEGHQNGIQAVAEVIAGKPDSRPLAALLQTAPLGAHAVTERYRSWVHEAFQGNRDSDA